MSTDSPEPTPAREVDDDLADRLQRASASSEEAEETDLVEQGALAYSSADEDEEDR